MELLSVAICAGIVLIQWTDKSEADYKLDFNSSNQDNALRIESSVIKANWILM